MPYQLFADIILVIHFSIVAFVVVGLPLVVVGNLAHWSWVNALWFRLLHLASIGVVVVESLFGITCPLTTLEDWLRRQAHETSYSGGFVEHWVRRLMFFSGPPWVFTLCYCVFGLLVLATWWFFPPRFKKAR